MVHYTTSGEPFKWNSGNSLSHGNIYLEEDQIFEIFLVLSGSNTKGTIGNTCLAKDFSLNQVKDQYPVQSVPNVKNFPLIQDQENYNTSLIF